MQNLIIRSAVACLEQCSWYLRTDRVSRSSNISHDVSSIFYLRERHFTVRRKVPRHIKIYTSGNAQVDIQIPRPY